MKKISALVIGLSVAVVIIWDFYAYFSGGTQATVSQIIWDFQSTNPVFSFATGFIMGHLFWSKK